MDPQPMLSVVIPMYNAERTIQATLWSLLRQPCLEQIEILCVDDGSADSTIEKCRYLMRFSDRIRLITLPHHGVSFARNRGIEAAGAPYVAFLDSDDCWTEGFFDEQILSLLRQAEDLYGFGWATVSSDQGRTRVFPAPDRQISGGLSAVEACTQSFCAFFYRRQFLRNCRICFPEGIQFNEDEIFKMNCLYRARTLRFFPRLLFTNLLRANSQRTGRYSREGRRQLIRAWTSAEESFRRGPEASPGMVRYCRFVLCRLLDKMNREYRLDAEAVTMAAEALPEDALAYYRRVLRDGSWYGELWHRRRTLAVIALDAYGQSLTEAWSGHFSVSCLPPEHLSGGAAEERQAALLVFSASSVSERTICAAVYRLACARAEREPEPDREILAVADCCGEPDANEARARRLLTDMTQAADGCGRLAVCCVFPAERDGGKKVLGTSQLSVDRVRELYAAVFPGCFFE